MTENEKINGWTFEETIKCAENLMEVETNMFKWDVLRHLRDFAENYKEENQQYHAIGTVEDIQQKLAELKQWHTTVINDSIKNSFANSSTSICHNCDHKDEYIEELEAELQALKEKAVLIMDMPASCGKCQLKLVGEYLDVRCAIGHRIIPIAYGRPEWCPLKQISTGRTKA